ncbi:MAG: glycosyltransferase [Clostridiales bacterium]|nr:glycosyltransferase [Clostridiales bacterium]
MLTRQYTVDVIIPTYRPGDELVALIRALQEQEYPVHQILMIDTESGVFPEELPDESVRFRIVRIRPEEFDHGGTRMMGARLSEADIIVYMTQDAVPVDDRLIGSFVSVFEQHGDIGIAYGRQLPREDCGVIERFTRLFNYPEESRIKSKDDLGELGIKAFFCSDVCAAYRREYLLAAGGFVTPAIFNEDMIFAGQRILAGDCIAYAAGAQVIHSHNYTGWQQLQRNFDLAVSQTQHPEVFGGISSEGEGIRLVKETAGYLFKRGKLFLIFRLVFQSGCKYIGYFLGKRYEKLPRRLILRCSANRNYWKKYKFSPKQEQVRQGEGG